MDVGVAGGVGGLTFSGGHCRYPLTQVTSDSVRCLFGSTLSQSVVLVHLIRPVNAERICMQHMLPSGLPVSLQSPALVPVGLLLKAPSFFHPGVCPKI